MKNLKNKEDLGIEQREKWGSKGKGEMGGIMFSFCFSSVGLEETRSGFIKV